MKRTIIFLMSGLLLTAPLAWAECQMGGSGKNCPMMGKGGMGRGHRSQMKCPLTAKLFAEAHLYLENQDKLGLSQTQVDAIEQIKSDANKAYIRQTADMQIGMMDFNDKLSAPTVDVDGLNKMVDDSMAGMAAYSKNIIASYAKLKSTLTPDQAAKAEALSKSGGDKDEDGDEGEEAEESEHAGHH